MAFPLCRSRIEVLATFALDFDERIGLPLTGPFFIWDPRLPCFAVSLRPNDAPAALHDLPIAVLLAASRSTTDTQFDSQLNPQNRVSEKPGIF